MTDHSPPLIRLLAELKRRKVFKAVALYGAAVFGLLQVADVVIPAVGLPEKAVTLLVIASLAGFPIALFVAWTFDFTAHGLRRTASADSEELEAIIALPRLQRWPVGVLGLLGIGLLTYGAWYSGTRKGLEQAMGSETAGSTATDSAVDASAVASIAVLPFANFGDPQDEPFVDGLAEELGNTLAQIQGVRVAARSSAFAFKNRDVGAREIGKELGVGSIVEGSVRRAGGTVRISAQLSRTSDGFRLWSKSWERDLTAANVFAIQDQITSEIAQALTRELRPEAQAGLAERRTTNLEAYDLYLLGRHRWATRDEEAVREAIGYYEQAIASDSSFALAWAGLADAWGVLPFYDRTVNGSSAYERAVQAADRALALAPELAEANAARGIIATEYDRDFARGEQLLRKAVQLNPSYAQAQAWLCETLAAVGRDDEALAPCRKAVELNPFGFVPNLLLVVPLDGLGQTGAALEQAEKTAALFPDATFAQFLLADVQLRLGRRADAAASLEALARDEGASDPAALRAVAEAYPGKKPSEKGIAAVRMLEREGTSGLYYVAALYAWAGSKEDAIRLVREAEVTRSPWFDVVGTFAAYDPLRTDPAFQKILKDAGLPNGNEAYRKRMASGRP